MAVTTLGKPGDFLRTFTFPNTSTPDVYQYGILANGKIYRERIRKDGTTPTAGSRGTWVDTGLTIPDVSSVGDM